MADLTKPVILSNGGNRVGVQQGRDRAVFGYFQGYDDGDVTAWNLTKVDGGYKIQDPRTGRYLAMAPYYADGNGPRYAGKPQAVAWDDDPKAPNSTWTLTPVGDGDTVYTVNLTGTKSYLGRGLLEDRSVNPKPILLGPDADSVLEFWTITQA